MRLWYWIERTKYFDSGWNSMSSVFAGRYKSANTRRRGSAKAVLVYSMRGDCTARPHPQVSARRRARDEPARRNASGIAPPAARRQSASAVGEMAEAPAPASITRPRRKAAGVSDRPGMPKNARDRIGAAANGRTPRSTQADA